MKLIYEFDANTMDIAQRLTEEELVHWTEVGV